MIPITRRRFAALLAALPFAARAAGAPLKIATLGAGRVGSTLGGLWVKAGRYARLGQIGREGERVGMPLAGEHSPQEIRSIAATLQEK